LSCLSSKGQNEKGSGKVIERELSWISNEFHLDFSLRDELFSGVYIANILQ
jgi:hypothetical protein